MKNWKTFRRVQKRGHCNRVKKRLRDTVEVCKIIETDSEKPELVAFEGGNNI